MTAIPIPPKATGAVFAIRQMPAAYRDSKPKPTSIPAVIATGAPKPAAPSRKAPKQYAIRIAWSLLSGVTDSILFLTIVKLPVLTLML